MLRAGKIIATLAAAAARVTKAVEMVKTGVLAVASRAATRVKGLKVLSAPFKSMGKKSAAQEEKTAAKSAAKGEEPPPKGGSGEEPPRKTPEHNGPPETDPLAKDPATGKVSDGTIEEGIIARQMIKEGRLKEPVTRDPTGAAEFIDGDGVKWDVKAFRSTVPDSRGKGSYTRADTELKLSREVKAGHRIVIDTGRLNSAHIRDLQDLIAEHGWADKIKWCHGEWS